MSRQELRDDILERALALLPDQRESFLTEACGEDADLRQEIHRLLAANQHMSSEFLEHQLLSSRAENPENATTCEIPVPGVAPGILIGPYKVLRQLGEGGMGVVYHARQLHTIQRDVALKIIKPGMDSKQVIARFESERQALAILDHPNIARVFDAGTTTGGLPYFVMELVQGVPITHYCNSKRLTLRQRIELFIPVCQAIQHAHRKGIIHRDIKPSNILVGEQEGKPVPKAIDFGLAKALGHQVSDATMITQFGTVVGTLDYMSPEQASLNSRDIDTGTDLYSLGVVLYELLVGMLPLEIKSLREAAFDELLRVIRETPAPKPTARITQVGGAAEGMALQRSTNSAQLKRELAGDLDAIVMKAIDKDRNCRYASALELAADMGRYLRNEPVLASPPRAVYRARKFVRRNRTAVFVFLALIALIVTSTWEAMRVRRAEQQTQKIGAMVLGTDPLDQNFTDLRSFARAIFYTMKTIDVKIAKLEKMVAESGSSQAAEQAVSLRSQRTTLDGNYNRLLASLKVPNHETTEEQLLMLRVVRLFGECELDMPEDFFGEVQNYIQRWKSTGRFLQAVKRAQQNGYAGRIAQEFISQGLPPQFFYLAMLETGFDENAIGPLTNMGYAKGMWQFIPKTAEEYGLKLGPRVNLKMVDPLDDRHHWDRATRAAAAYMKNLYSTDAQASGFLVMACHSLAHRSELSVVKSMPNNPRDRNFWKLWKLYRAATPQETYGYVLFIVSAAVIGENPRLFEIDCDNPLRGSVKDPA